MLTTLFKQLISFTPALITGTLAIIGVVVGAKMSQKATIRIETRKMLADFYAELFVSYMTFLTNNTYEAVGVLLGKIERVKLLCSEESHDLLCQLQQEIPKENMNHEKCAIIIDQLRISAKNDIRNKKC